MEKETPLAGDEGFLRLEQVLELLPFRRSKWFAGVRDGTFPKPYKHGRNSFYRKKDIKELIAKIENGGAAA